MHSSNLQRTNQEPIKYRLENENDVDVNRKKNLTPEEFDGNIANVNVGANGETSAQVNEELTAEEDDQDSPDVVINNKLTDRYDGVNILNVNRESTAQETKANILELGQRKASIAQTDEANIPYIDINRESTAPKYSGNIPNFGISEENKVNIPDFGQINESTAQKNVNIPNIDKMALNSPSIFPKDMNIELTAQRYNGNIFNFGINNELTAQGNQANIAVGSENNQMNTLNVSMNKESISQDDKANITNIGTNEESIARNYPDGTNKELFVQKYNGNISQFDINKESTPQDYHANISNVGINTPSIAVNNQPIIPNVSMNKTS